MTSAFFPDPNRCNAEGLVAVGGELSTARLLDAYRHGIFPYFDDDCPVLWWSPDPRAVIELDGLYVSRRLARTIRSGRFSVTFDQAFDAVIRGCADRGEGTWITPDMIHSYNRLHRKGYAHSVEVWHEGQLAGGVYGVTVGGVFAGESMFTRVPDASKVALVHLVGRLKERGFVVLDVQYRNDHTESLGAVEIPRSRYLTRLKAARDLPIAF
jgi:leucyl/phenylalanyl-tRNA--protein transferase